MEQFIFPAVFFQEDGETDYTVVFPDLNISTEGKTLIEAFLLAKDYLRVYCSYARKFDMGIDKPSRFVDIAERFPNYICMLIDAFIPQQKNND